MLLTDGEVPNTDEILKYVRAHSKTTRCFTFGIGGDVSLQLGQIYFRQIPTKTVSGVAHASGGKYEMVESHSLTKKVLRHLNRAQQPGS